MDIHTIRQDKVCSDDSELNEGDILCLMLLELKLKSCRFFILISTSALLKLSHQEMRFFHQGRVNAVKSCHFMFSLFSTCVSSFLSPMTFQFFSFDPFFSLLAPRFPSFPTVHSFSLLSFRVTAVVWFS
ncbi:hypothetical protein KFK09_009717 [Dendrobium nobile]|uniref:Uncharacterized protein n=1 Tax=Dendrobium nobile TaxID=94219 RepID=A0A8T3BHX0_DENNO|nr:hypothetical protein KFK09_009717 [Dendrobium nobile]